MQVFTINFSAGTFGNFMCYLINEHKNFPNIDTSKIREKVDPFIDGAKFRHMKVPVQYKDYLHDDVPCKNPLYSKICIIPTIHGNADYLHEVQEEDLMLRHMDYYKIVGTFNDNVHDALMLRFSTETEKQYRFNVQFTMIELYKKFKQENRPALLLYINEIMQCNEEEYLKLCSFIGEEPLDNWKEIVQQYWKTHVQL